VLVHGSLCDFRYWTSQMPAFSAAFRTISVSLRHYYPRRWNGEGDDFNIPQHMVDVVAFGNILRHEYHATSSKVVWDVVRADLPELKAAIQAIQAVIAE
jgi:hypothetical protein